LLPRTGISIFPTSTNLFASHQIRKKEKEMQVVRTLREGLIVQEASAPMAVRISFPVGQQLLVESGPAQTQYKTFLYVQMEQLPEDIRNRIQTFLDANRM
jgi:hypothetical protein